jgi:hypothetical protein
MPKCPDAPMPLPQVVKRCIPDLAGIQGTLVWGEKEFGVKYISLLLDVAVLAVVLLLIAAPTQGAVTVTLSSTTSPSSGQPGTTNISVTGSGFPSGTIPAANVTVTLQPSGGGASVATTASAVRMIAGPVEQVRFQIPASVMVSVATTYQVSIAGTTSTGVAFSSGNTSALTVIPAASIAAVFPATRLPGQTLSVTITAAPSKGRAARPRMQAASSADPIAVGDIEFNSLSPGINSFTINNFTGTNNLGFFPVAGNVTFDNVVLTATEADGTVLTFNLGSIGPSTNTDAQVADSLLFTQVVFFGTLDPSTFNLTNGFSGTFAADPALSFTLLPSSGSYLVADVDFGTINASPVPINIPDASTLSLLALILGILALTMRQLAKPSARESPRTGWRT